MTLFFLIIGKYGFVLPNLRAFISEHKKINNILNCILKKKEINLTELKQNIRRNQIWITNCIF